MKKLIISGVVILAVILLVPISCAAPAIKTLTGSEKNTMVRVALAHPEVTKWLETAEVYGVEVGWSIVSWNNSEATGWARVAYEEIADGSFPPAKLFPPESTSIHPDVLLRLKYPPRMHIHIAFDRKTMEVVAVQFLERPATGPSPAPAPSPPPPPASSPDYPNHGITTTKVELGGEGVMVFINVPPFTVDDLVRKSDTIITGRVVDIFPSRMEPLTMISSKTTIFTDVIIQTEEYLFGDPQTALIAVRVEGGRVIDDRGVETVMRVDASPVFDLGEEVALFLSRIAQPNIPPEGFESAEYYRVTGSMQGKLGYKDGNMTNLEGDSFTVSEVEQKIASIHGGE